MVLLTIDNLCVGSSGRHGLRDICLDIEVGETVSCFGKSGAGKTLLARAIGGLESPNSGEIAFDDLADGSYADVTVASSRPGYAGELTVNETLWMFAQISGVPRRYRAKRITFLMELLEIDNYRSKRTACAPDGVLRRMEIARALLVDAPLLVFDSLFDTLDADIYEKLWSYLLTLRRDDDRAILVMTASGRIAQACDRVIALHRGRIRFTGRPDDLRRLAGEDMIVLGNTGSIALRKRLQEQFSVTVNEEDGFLSFRVSDGDDTVGSLLGEFGSDIGCVYMKRPTLEDALEVLAEGSKAVLSRHAGERMGG